MRIPATITAPWQTNRRGFVAPVDPEPEAGISALAETALVLVGVSPLAILFGHAARTNINRTHKSGDALAVAALVLGYLESVAVIVVIAIAH